MRRRRRIGQIIGVEVVDNFLRGGNVVENAVRKDVKIACRSEIACSVIVEALGDLGKRAVAHCNTSLKRIGDGKL